MPDPIDPFLTALFAAPSRPKDSPGPLETLGMHLAANGIDAHIALLDKAVKDYRALGQHAAAQRTKNVADHLRKAHEEAKKVTPIFRTLEEYQADKMDLSRFTYCMREWKEKA